MRLPDHFIQTYMNIMNIERNICSKIYNKNMRIYIMQAFWGKYAKKLVNMQTASTECNFTL